jgi:hypothetical protein
MSINHFKNLSNRQRQSEDRTNELKSEPIEQILEQNQPSLLNAFNNENQPNSYQPSSSSSSPLSSGSESSARVNNQQVLNLLEELSKSFTPPDQSINQGLLNF